MSDPQDEREEEAPGEPETDGSEHASEGGSLGPGEADFSGALDDEEEGHEGPGLAGTVALAEDDLRGALEALILVSDKPIAAVRLARLTRQDLGVVKRALAELQQAYQGRGIVLDEIAGGYQFRTSPRYAAFVRNLVQQKPTRLSRAQLEVLAIIAYRQPITRPEIEDVRGVDSGSAIKVLLERNVIKILGKKDDAGRPMLYGTTTEFLELFGLKSLRDLPTLKEFTELTAESRDIFERRIGEPLPGHGEGMNLETHYEAPPESAEPEPEEEAPEDGAQAAPEGREAPEPSGDAEAQVQPADDEPGLEAEAGETLRDG